MMHLLLHGPGRNLQRMVGETVVFALDRGIPIPDLLGAIAADEPWWRRKPIEKFSNLLEDGVPLSAAIEQSYHLFPPHVRSAVGVGTETGIVRAVLDEALQSREPTAVSLFQRVIPLHYLFFVLIALAVVLGYSTHLRISDTLREIANSPSAGAHAESYGKIVPRIAMAALCLAAGIAAVGLARWRGIRLPLPAFPAIAGRLSGQRMAPVLQLLGTTRGLGRPIAGAISSLARHWHDRAIADRLLFVRNELEYGVSPWRAMQERALLSRAHCTLLDAANAVGNESWALRFLSHWKSRNGLERQGLVSFAARLLLLVLIAAAVTFVGHSIFGLLADCISKDVL